jgi:hypothetical protein
MWLWCFAGSYPPCAAKVMSAGSTIRDSLPTRQVVVIQSKVFLLARYKRGFDRAPLHPTNQAFVGLYIT